jgi:hypothetical protein
MDESQDPRDRIANNEIMRLQVLIADLKQNAYELAFALCRRRQSHGVGG